MARTEIYETSVAWTGGHRGRIRMGNGPELDFSAPPASHGEAGVLTPEDAFVGAVNTCVMLMYIWAAERLRLDLVSYECRAEGTKLVELDRTETFSQGRPEASDRHPARKRGACRGRTAGAPRHGFGPEVQPRRQLDQERAPRRACDRGPYSAFTSMSRPAE